MGAPDRSHWKANVSPAVSHVPGFAVSTCPTFGTPLTVGAEVLTGAVAPPPSPPPPPAAHPPWLAASTSPTRTTPLRTGGVVMGALAPGQMTLITRSRRGGGTSIG